MKVKVLRGYLGKEGRVHSGDRLDISEPRFRQLTEGRNEKNPLVAATEVGYKMQERLQNKMEPAPKNKRLFIDLGGKKVDWANEPLEKDADGTLQRSVKEAAKEAPKGRFVQAFERGVAKRAAMDAAEVAEKAGIDPTPSPPAGGLTGAESAASSSELAPAPAKRKYTRRAEKPESSPSIGRGNWRRGQTSSTAATSPGGKNTRASRTSKE